MKCGLVGLEPMPGAELWETLYADPYFEAYSVHHGQTKGYAAGRSIAEEIGRGRLTTLAHHIPPGRLLDVGCAGGHFLGVARDWGYEVMGVEYNASMADLARQRGFEVLQGDVMRLDLPGRHEVIHIEDVLEHLLSPLALLKKLALHLAPGGVIVIDGPLEEQPNLTLWLQRLNRQLRKVEDPELAPTHLWLFRLETLGRLLRRAGFRARWVRVYEDAKPPIPRTGMRVPDLRRGVAEAVQRLSMGVCRSNFMRFLNHGDRVLGVYEPVTPCD